MPFEFKSCNIPGLVIIEPAVFGDSRGFFCETYKKQDFVENGIEFDFVQDNHSYSSKGVLRGLHLQLPPMDQGKLVGVITGAVWDVAVDLRNGSPTYLKWYGIELTEENKKMFYIPPGFAHGFVVLKDATHFLYKCTNYYSPEHERGIRFDDSAINVEWPVRNPRLSERDKTLPLLSEVRETLEDVWSG